MNKSMNVNIIKYIDSCITQVSIQIVNLLINFCMVFQLFNLISLTWQKLYDKFEAAFNKAIGD